MAGIRRSAGAAAGASQDGDPCAVEGRYANYFEVGSNHFELVIDCGQFYAGCSAPIMHTRIITSPAYAHGLIESLTEALARPSKGRKEEEPGAGP